MSTDFTEEDTYPHLKSALESHLDETIEIKQQTKVEYELEYVEGEIDDTRSFETDLAVFQAGVPRVIIEVKRSSVNTHAVMYHDTKAEAHKDVYPFLRYGMLVVDANRRMTKKYLWHSDVMDFFYFDDTDMTGPDDFNPNRMAEFADLVEQHLTSSRAIQRVLNGDHNPQLMSRPTEFAPADE